MSVLAALCFLLLAACCVDYRKKKIPNLLIAVMVFFGIGWRFWREGAEGIVAFTVQATVVAGLLYLLFRLGTVGAGDVKLFGVTAGYLPFKKILIFLFVSLLIAAFFSLVKLWKKNNFGERLHFLEKYLWDVYKGGRWKLYIESGVDSSDYSICFSGPILLSLLFYLGGVY